MVQTSVAVTSAEVPEAQPRRRPEWMPQWSVPSAYRALRTVIVVPALFALTFEGFGNLQIALFAAFGGFASLVLANFGGTRRDKLIAHLGLAITGSIALIIGTAVSGTTALATIVTIPVAFGIFFAGVAGPNAAGGVTAALLAYVLPVASPGNASMIPDRLAGWWLASVVATAAVLLLSPPAAGDRLRAAAGATARAYADLLDALVQGGATQSQREAAAVAKHQLMMTFASTPYRPTGLATADQGLGSLVEELEWCGVLVTDAIDEDPDFPEDRELLAATAAVLKQIAALLGGADITPRIEEMEQLRVAGCERQRASDAHTPDEALAVARRAFHEQAIAVAVRAVVADALIATRRADPETVAARRRGWYGAPPEGTAAERRVAALHGAVGVLARHASLRSVWMLNAIRGSLALAAAVLVADLSGVQHGFWVVLGTMSVLRTNAATTESTALRALGGTVIGFVVGALLLLGIGTSTAALWVALPIAVAIAAYAPGALPFMFGQAAFNVVVVVLFNILVPVGWKVGVLRIEDVAIGCVVSLVVGLLFWPRGAGGIVGDDLADSYRRGAAYLTEAVNWALGLRPTPPRGSAASAITAGIRLDEGVRGFLAEQGSKRVSPEDLWRLVMASTRLRLTAYSLASLRPEHACTPQPDGAEPPGMAETRVVLARTAGNLAEFYDQVALLVGRPVANQVIAPLRAPSLDELERSHHHAHLLWIRENLHHLASRAPALTEPAARIAEQRRQPWWR
ncbi:MAG TPA: FUSC family protein [Streptosporangiaceae bacterium]